VLIITSIDNAISALRVFVSVEAAEWRTTQNNGWNGANGIASKRMDVFDTIPLIPLQLLP
jgi:hypothetical protein